MPGGSTFVPICGVSAGRVVPLDAPPEGLGDLAGLSAEGFAGRLVCVTETDSTNRLALSLAPELADGDAVLADGQTAGRGRLGRTWHSPRGGNLYLTVALRPAVAPSLLPGCTLAAAIALADSLDGIVAAPLTIRWPNDLLAGGAKIAGILAQTSPEPGGGRFVALGIGINLLEPEGGFPADLRTPATSVAAAAGRKVPRPLVLSRFLAAFARVRAELAGAGLPALVAARPALFPFLGGPITIERDGAVLQGTALAIGPGGALVVRTADGRVAEVTSGELAAGTPERGTR